MTTEDRKEGIRMYNECIIHFEDFK